MRHYNFIIEPFVIKIQSERSLCFLNSFKHFKKERSDAVSQYHINIAIEAKEFADINNIQRINGIWYISRHRPYLYLPKVLAYEGFEREELLLLLHSCLLTDSNGLGHLFLARSGTGKSTLARKMHGLMIGGNDETNIIYCRDGLLYGASTPFYTIDKIKNSVISSLAVPLKHIYILTQEERRSSHIGKQIEPDTLWMYLVEGQASTPYTKREYFGAYHRMLNNFVDNYPVFVFHHNLKDSPENIYENLDSYHSSHV